MRYVKIFWIFGICGFDYKIAWKMALEASEIKEEVILDVGKSKGRNKKDRGETETGCWVSTTRFFGSFISSRTKVDSSTCGPAAPFGNSIFALSRLVVCAQAFLLEY